MTSAGLEASSSTPYIAFAAFNSHRVKCFMKPSDVSYRCSRPISLNWWKPLSHMCYTTQSSMFTGKFDDIRRTFCSSTSSLAINQITRHSQQTPLGTTSSPCLQTLFSDRVSSRTCSAKSTRMPLSKMYVATVTLVRAPDSLRA